MASVACIMVLAEVSPVILSHGYLVLIIRGVLIYSGVYITLTLMLNGCCLIFVGNASPWSWILSIIEPVNR